MDKPTTISPPAAAKKCSSGSSLAMFKVKGQLSEHLGKLGIILPVERWFSLEFGGRYVGPEKRD